MAGIRCHRQRRSRTQTSSKLTRSNVFVDLPQVPPRYHATYFSHGGTVVTQQVITLTSGQVLDDDAFYWFKEHGG
jgi:hypothetical protein